MSYYYNMKTLLIAGFILLISQAGYANRVEDVPGLKASQENSFPGFIANESEENTIVVGWTFPDAENPGADYGTEENLGKLVSREGGFSGDYNYYSGVTTQSISATGWVEGEGLKFWQIEFSTLGFEGLTLSSAQRSSNTGPRDFKLQYRIAQEEWQDVPGSEILVANNFTSGVLSQISLPSDMNDNASVSLRWIMTSNTSVNGGDIAAAGTSRIDDIFVEGLPTGFVPNVISVASLPGLQAELGTPFSDLPLPETVAVTLSNNLEVDMNVAWLEGDYNPDVPADYLISGNLLLPDGVTNDNEIQAQITVSVVEEIIFLNIISVHVPDQVILVEEGTPFEEVDLPAMVDVTLENDSVMQLEVNWQPGNYDPQIPALYPVQGDLVLLEGIANPLDLVAEIMVEVVEVSQEVIIAGWNFPDDTQQADVGIEANIGKLISREPAFEGDYSYTAGATGSAISTTQWAEGEGVKYWIVEISTIGYGNLTLSSKQRSSGTGPRDFKLQYRIGTEGSWTDLDGSEVTVDNNFTTGVLSNFEIPAAANNKPFLFIRWIMDSNISVNEEDVAAGGTSRIDEIFIHGVFSSDFKRIVTGVQPLQPLEVEQGTPFGELELPDLVSVIFDDEGTELLPVTWLEGDYDGDQLGSYIVFGEITLSDGMENPDNIMAQVEVNVIPPIQLYSVTFNVDMSNASGFDPETDDVLITGSMFDFAIPGTLPDEQTLAPATGMTYTLTMQLQEGSYIYKYYINAGVGNPEPGADRQVMITGDTIFNDLWGATMITQTDLPVVKIFPNPAADVLHIAGNSPMRNVTITNVSGMEVYREQLNDTSATLRISDLQKGIYLVRIQTDGLTITRKLVVH
ncbi:MAG: T9SS type A sorting domain-containing protein [Bacteroidota bacterium]